MADATQPPTQPQPAQQPQSAPPASPRPVGLTLMAILNFIFGGLGIVSLFIIFQIYRMGDTAVQFWAPEGALAIALRPINVLLIFASGVGYLSRSKFLGWGLGNAYACMAIVTVIAGAISSEVLTPMSAFWLIYPTLTLILVNTVFKKDLRGALGGESRRAVMIGLPVVAVLGGVIVAVGALSFPREREIESIQVVDDDDLGSHLEKATRQRVRDCARKISFPKVSAKPAGIDDLKMVFVVRNDSDRTVQRLEVEVSLLDDSGVQVAWESETLAGGGWGDNEAPIPPASSKYAECELDDARKWKPGKVVVKITELEVK